MINHKQHRYLSDDRDKDPQIELVITHAPNGDYYIGTCKKGDVFFPQARICTSGGCASLNPELLQAIAAVFQALGGWEEKGEE